MWNLYWTGVRLPSPPLMKTKVILLSLYLLLNSINILRHNEVFQFLIDGRPKCVTYYKTTFMFIHIEVEVVEPKVISRNRAGIECMNIYFFSETYHLHHTIHWRYIKFIEA